VVHVPFLRGALGCQLADGTVGQAAVLLGALRAAVLLGAPGQAAVLLGATRTGTDWCFFDGSGGRSGSGGDGHRNDNDNDNDGKKKSVRVHHCERKDNRFVCVTVLYCIVLYCMLVCLSSFEL